MSTLARRLMDGAILSSTLYDHNVDDNYKQLFIVFNDDIDGGGVVKANPKGKYPYQTKPLVATSTNFR